MKFLCLAYGAEEDWLKLTEAEQDDLLAQDEVLRQRGDTVAALYEPVTVSMADGRVVTRAEPFAVSRVPLAGFGIIEADSLEEAISLVCNTPCVGANGAVELRQLR